jgi:hypothetical protein
MAEQEIIDELARQQILSSLRQDGTPKGLGWLGVIPGTGSNVGKDMTELSIGVEWDGKENVIPSLVPTLAPDEIAHIAGGGEVTRPIMLKAMEHAKARMAEGKSVWADTPTYDSYYQQQQAKILEELSKQQLLDSLR